MTLPPLLVAQAGELLRSPLCWSIMLGAISLWLLFARRTNAVRGIGKMLGGISLIMLATTLMIIGDWSSQIVFWFLAAVTIVGAAAAIISRNPVYMAIWFAVSLLGTAGLFLFQGAQFLGVATVVVYAGAIVVTFLFVLMLAQPEGHAPYDRISWASFAIPAALVGAAAVIAIVLTSLDSLKAVDEKSPTPAIVASQQHMAELGSHMFAYHLVAIEVVGTLLLVALVGAIAIVIQGREPQADSPSDIAQMPNAHGDLPGGAR
ncbi:MAG: NADH-quinone oxidoreductase subunit J [Pirellulaceae bacterium]|nr:NADH-quinone oxidoreductase subunit J [Pirellulaceae bacterium]MDP6553863.1 NADH-quinone oxidoreductase subunit J [Pirellulaceae bacterium]